MSEQGNTKNVNQDTVKSPEIDTAGIYDILNLYFRKFLALQRISEHLHEINEILESMDNELLEYRNCVKKTLQEKTEAHNNPAIKFYWTKQIEKEMKIFYSNTAYCLKVLCQNFCVQGKHYCNV